MKKSGFSKILGYIFIPVFFSIIGYILLYVALRPIAQTAVGMVSIFISDDIPQFNTDLRSVYDPDAARDNSSILRTDTIYSDDWVLENGTDLTIEDISADNDSADVDQSATDSAGEYQVLEVEDIELDESQEENLIRKYVRFEPAETDDPDAAEVSYIYLDDSGDDQSETPSAFMVVKEEAISDAESGGDGSAADAANGAGDADTGDDISSSTQRVAYIYNIDDGEPDNNGPVLRFVMDDADSADSSVQDIYIYETEDENGNEQEIAYVVGTGDAAGDHYSEDVDTGYTEDGTLEGGADDSGQKAVSYKYMNVFNPFDPTYKYIHIEDIEYPKAGDHYADLICKRIGLDAPVYWHDTSDILRYGVGQYIGSYPPGFNRMILLSGHNNTWFTPLKDIKEGDIIRFNTNYCEYRYKVTDVQVLDENDLEDFIYEHLRDDEELLVMYTCYPFEATVGRKTNRLTVFAKRIKGYDVKWRFIDE